MFKVVIGDPKTGKSYQVELKEPSSRALIGKRIGDTFEGGLVGLPGYELQITGGTDVNGFPMRPDVPGPGHQRVLLSRGPGYRPKKKGERRRKRVHGCVVAEDIRQLNVKIVKYGEKPVEELLKPLLEKKS
ncbi:MAG: 30S ribosomal protein S6e [Hadesarchaea archaeon]|nr:MAG: 30S ribosomal protein S6e [Hadesarchaea archaeon]TDA36380.1 MAG: 30S ribosomal protein S6e [Hadesarchaea archaeon]